MTNPTNSPPPAKVRPTGDGVLSTQTDLPARRAFVVQLNGSSAIPDGQFVGRVEHLFSGQRGHFESLAELRVFISKAVIQSETSR